MTDSLSSRLAALEQQWFYLSYARIWRCRWCEHKKPGHRPECLGSKLAALLPAVQQQELELQKRLTTSAEKSFIEIKTKAGDDYGACLVLLPDSLDRPLHERLAILLKRANDEAKLASDLRATVQQLEQENKELRFKPPVCLTCGGRGWIMKSESRDLGGGIGTGAAWNEPCPLCAAPKESPSTSGDVAENTTDNPHSWIAWKRRAEQAEATVQRIEQEKRDFGANVRVEGLAWEAWIQKAKDLEAQVATLIAARETDD